MAKNDLTAARVRELFNYNSETGALTWAFNVGPTARVGGIAGSLEKKGYRSIGVDGSYYKAHRLIWLHVTGQWPIGQIDHKDGDKDNNRWDNLRDVTSTVNQQNTRAAVASNRSCGLLGVTPNRKRWKTSICIDGVKRHLGTFDTAEEAHAVYLAAKRKHHEGCTI